MKFKHVQNITVNVGDTYHFFVKCDEVSRVHSEHPFYPWYLVFKKNGEIISRIPEKYVVSFYYHKGVLSPEIVTVMNVAFETVL